MSLPLGTKVKLLKPWRVYSTGTILEQGFYADLEELVKSGYAACVEAETPARPAKLGARAAKKIADGVKKLI